MNKVLANIIFLYQVEDHIVYFESNIPSLVDDSHTQHDGEKSPSILNFCRAPHSKFAVLFGVKV